MDFVGNAKPPVNQNGSCVGTSDSGILNRTGRSCSADIVWLQAPLAHSLFLHSSEVDEVNLLSQDSQARNIEHDLRCYCIPNSGGVLGDDLLAIGVFEVAVI